MGSVGRETNCRAEQWRVVHIIHLQAATANWRDAQLRCSSVFQRPIGRKLRDSCVSVGSCGMPTSDSLFNGRRGQILTTDFEPGVVVMSGVSGCSLMGARQI